MKIKIGMFEFEGSQVEFDQLVKSGLLDKCLSPVKIDPKKIDPKKIGNEDLWKILSSGEKSEKSNMDFYKPQPGPWPRIDPAELGIDTLKAKEAYLLSEIQGQNIESN